MRQRARDLHQGHQNVPSTVTDISTVGTVAATKLLNSVYCQMIAQNGSCDVGVTQVVTNEKRYLVAVLGAKNLSVNNINR